jgi:2,3-dihydroxyphenylpropionate 1,2-dioxygenase
MPRILCCQQIRVKKLILLLKVKKEHLSLKGGKKMGKIVLGLGAPHAPQLVSEPETWGEIYELVTCASKIGPKPELLKETLEDNRTQYRSVQKCFSVMRQAIEEAKLDALIALTDDHFDNFFLDDYPPFSVYIGSKVQGSTIWMPNRKFEFDCDEKLEKAILEQSLSSGFDLSFSEEIYLEYGHLVPLSYVFSRSEVPLVPIYINVYANPQPTPNRCYQLGKFLASVVEKYTRPDLRVGILASGGMSHYPGEPLGGEVDLKTDMEMMEFMKAGKGSKFAELTSEKLDESGNGEMRNWIAMMGALGNVKPWYAEYILSWRAIIGLGFLIWKTAS